MTYDPSILQTNIHTFTSLFLILTAEYDGSRDSHGAKEWGIAGDNHFFSHFGGFLRCNEVKGSEYRRYLTPWVMSPVCVMAAAVCVCPVILSPPSSLVIGPDKPTTGVLASQHSPCITSR